jgi:hypothetical protein
MAREIKRLPRWAERKFELLCDAYGAIPHRPDEDQNGWDYYVEFPEKAMPRYADMQQRINKAHVQVKSTKKAHYAVKVSLSNALKAAQDDLPWFLTLIVARNGEENVEVFSVHIWEAHMREFLKRIREASVLGQKLNKYYITVRFTEADRHKDLIEWMDQCINEVAGKYGEAKRNLYESLGFEGGQWKGTFSIPIGQENPFYDCLVGKEEPIKVSRFSASSTRFGLTPDVPDIEVENAIMHIKAHPVGEVEIRIRGANDTEALIEIADVYPLNMPDVPKEKKRIRFATETMEIVYTSDGRTTVSSSLDYTKKYHLPSIRNFARIVMQESDRQLDVQIWAKGQRIMAGRLTVADVTPDMTNWQGVFNLTAILMRMAGLDKARRIEVSLSELRQKSVIRALQAAVTSGEIIFKFPLGNGNPDSSEIVYFVKLGVGAYLLFGLFARPVLRTIIENGHARLICGEPEWIDAYALRNPDEHQHDIMTSDYKRAIEHRGTSATPFGIGDLGAYVPQNETGPDASG